jgi:hypothetical protein
MNLMLSLLISGTVSWWIEGEKNKNLPLLPADVPAGGAPESAWPRLPFAPLLPREVL